jgi:hypothetical protein
MDCEDINALVLYVEQQTVIHTHFDPYILPYFVVRTNIIGLLNHMR